MAQSLLHPENTRPTPFRLRQKSGRNRLWMNIGQTKSFMDGGAPQPGTSSPSAFRRDSGEKGKRDGNRRYGFHELPDTAIQADETRREESPVVCRHIAEISGKWGNVFQGVFHGVFLAPIGQAVCQHHAFGFPEKDMACRPSSRMSISSSVRLAVSCPLPGERRRLMTP